MCYLAMGSNVGDRKRNIQLALDFIQSEKEIRLLKVSSLFETAPVGGPPQSYFLNNVLKLETSLSARGLLDVCRQIEKKVGRKKTVKWGPRIIDIDILTFGRQVLASQNLKIPHPQYHKRRFVLVPFCELAPSFVHPRLKLKNQILLAQLTSEDQRVTISAQWKKSRYYPFKRKKSKKSPSSH